MHLNYTDAFNTDTDAYYTDEFKLLSCRKLRIKYVSTGNFYVKNCANYS